MKSIPYVSVWLSYCTPSGRRMTRTIWVDGSSDAGAAREAVLAKFRATRAGRRATKVDCAAYAWKRQVAE